MAVIVEEEVEETTVEADLAAEVMTDVVEEDLQAVVPPILTQDDAEVDVMTRKEGLVPQRALNPDLVQEEKTKIEARKTRKGQKKRIRNQPVPEGLRKMENILKTRTHQNQSLSQNLGQNVDQRKDLLLIRGQNLRTRSLRIDLGALEWCIFD